MSKCAQLVGPRPCQPGTASRHFRQSTIGSVNAADVPARYPDLRVHDDRAVEADHADLLAVRARRRVADHVLPPGVLDVPLQLDAERAVVPEAVDAAVDFAGLEDEPHVLAELGELGHVDPGRHRQTPPTKPLAWAPP